MSEQQSIADASETSATGPDRRTVLAGMAAPVLASALPFPALAGGAGETVTLPAPRLTGGAPLMEAIAGRRSSRRFSDRPLDQETLSDLLWAGFGINRPESGGRTAPSWHGSYGTDIYMADSQGVWFYEAKDHAIRRVMADDIRAEIGVQPFVETAPAVLVYATDLSRMYEAPEEEQRRFAYIDTGFVAQNVYLFAASAGLATVVIGSIKAEAVAQRLGLGERQLVTFGQPIGHPA